MKIALKCFLTLVSATLPSATIAKWTASVNITSAFTEDSDAIVIYTTGGANEGCAQNSWVFAAATDERRGRALAVALTALSLGKKVQFWYSGTCGAFGFHQVSAIMVVG